MGILKKGSYNEVSISNFSYSNVNLSKKENTDNLKISQEEYDSILNEAKELGYKEGIEKGYNEGYTQGVEKFEEEKQGLYAQIESDKDNLKSFLESESAAYINNFKINIQNLVVDSINKIFLNALNNEDILNIYIKNLISLFNESFENYIVSVNEKTLHVITSTIDKNKGSYKIDNLLNDYDILVFTSDEYKEYFLYEEFNKIKELFN